MGKGGKYEANRMDSRPSLKHVDRADLLCLAVNSSYAAIYPCSAGPSCTATLNSKSEKLKGEEHHNIL